MCIVALSGKISAENKVVGVLCKVGRAPARSEYARSKARSGVRGERASLRMMNKGNIAVRRKSGLQKQRKRRDAHARIAQERVRSRHKSAFLGD